MTPTTPGIPLSNRKSRLSQIDIAAPCEADWDQMRGDDRVRHCDSCHLNVYNLSAMTSQEAEALLERHEGRVCVRLYRRADGTVLTQDCPRGVERIRRRLRRIAGALAGALTVLVGGVATVTMLRQQGAAGVVMGDVAAPVGLMGKPAPTRAMMGEPMPIANEQ